MPLKKTVQPLDSHPWLGFGAFLDGKLESPRRRIINASIATRSDRA